VLEGMHEASLAASPRQPTGGQEAVRPAPQPLSHRELARAVAVRDSSSW
jgi:hypothetical protein